MLEKEKKTWPRNCVNTHIVPPWVRGGRGTRALRQGRMLGAMGNNHDFAAAVISHIVVADYRASRPFR